MRNVLLIALVVLTSNVYLLSKVWTVSTNADIPAQYNNLQTAADNASNGDTIYVHPSNSSYGIDLNKELHIIGNGYNAKELPLISTIDHVRFKTGSSKSTLTGLKIGAVNYSDAGNNVTNISVKRCRISGAFKINGDNWLIYNNIFDLVGSSTYFQISYSNIFICNNIFNFLEVYGNRGNISSSFKSSVYIRNNVFYGVYYVFQSINNANIENNVFFHAPPRTCSLSTFNNNITYQIAVETPLPYGDNSGSNNLVENNPKFADTTGTTDNYPYDRDFHLLSDSPGKNAGTDGTDIGIFGGDFPWPEKPDGNTDYSGKPTLPQITEFSILNTIVGKTSKVKFKSKAEVHK